MKLTFLLYSNLHLNLEIPESCYYKKCTLFPFRPGTVVVLTRAPPFLRGLVVFYSLTSSASTSFITKMIFCFDLNFSSTHNLAYFFSYMIQPMKIHSYFTILFFYQCSRQPMYLLFLAPSCLVSFCLIVSSFFSISGVSLF